MGAIAVFWFRQIGRRDHARMLCEQRMASLLDKLREFRLRSGHWPQSLTDPDLWSPAQRAAFDRKFDWTGLRSSVAFHSLTDYKLEAPDAQHWIRLTCDKHPDKPISFGDPTQPFSAR